MEQFETRLMRVVDVEEREKLIEGFKRKEIDFLDLKRTKMSVDDFKSIKLIGKGAFGIVNNNSFFIFFYNYRYLCRLNWSKRLIMERFMR